MGKGEGSQRGKQGNWIDGRQIIRDTDTESKTETHTQRTLTMKSLETRSRDRHSDIDRERGPHYNFTMSVPQSRSRSHRARALLCNHCRRLETRASPSFPVIYIERLWRATIPLWASAHWYEQIKQSHSFFSFIVRYSELTRKTK